MEAAACSVTRRRPGELLPRGGVCQLHTDREEAEQCGIALGSVPKPVTLAEVRPPVYRVAWALSDAAGGRLGPGSDWGHLSRRPRGADLSAAPS